MVGGWANKGYVVFFKDFSKTGIFRQKTIARMDGVGASDFAGGKKMRHVEIALGRRRWANTDTFVGQTHMHGVGVGGGMYGDCGDAQFFARPLNAQSDLAAIGNQDLIEHGLATCFQD